MRHLSKAGDDFPIPVVNELKKAPSGLIYDMRRNLLGLDIEGITTIEIIRVFKNPRLSCVPITRASCENTFPIAFEWLPILPSLLLFFKNKAKTLESQGFLDHLVTRDTATQVLTFLFAKLKSELKFALLQQLTKTPFAEEAIWLFFINLESLEEQRSFVREAFFDALKLRSFKKKLPFLLRNSPELEMERAEIAQRHAWLKALLADKGDKMVYLENSRLK